MFFYIFVYFFGPYFYLFKFFFYVSLAFFLLHVVLHVSSGPATVISVLFVNTFALSITFFFGWHHLHYSVSFQDRKKVKEPFFMLCFPELCFVFCYFNS
jgi:hypothetical protein